MPLWHPDAKRVTYPNIGGFINVPPKGLLHTTETPTMPGGRGMHDARDENVILLGVDHTPIHRETGRAMDEADADEARRQLKDGARWVYSGSAPHFTIDPSNGDLQQHMPINVGAMALKNLSGGVETNRANVVQIEQIGYAGRTQDWPARSYDVVAELGRWVERNHGVKRSTSIPWKVGTRRLSGPEWYRYNEWLDHAHAPENDHWDCGNYRIAEFLDARADPYRHLNGGERGPDVEAFQRAVNRINRRCCRDDHLVEVDGVFGPKTLTHGGWAVWLIGVGQDREHVEEGGIGPKEQLWARDYDERPDSVKEKGAERRKKHCNCKED